MAEIARLLTCEATRDLPLEWPPSMPGVARSKSSNWRAKLTVAPILRAGLGMLDGVLDVIPCAKISVIGMSRRGTPLAAAGCMSETGAADRAMARLAGDPMLATGGSLFAAIRLLKQAGCQHIRAMVLVASPDATCAAGTATSGCGCVRRVIDSHLDANGFIIPGAGRCR